MYCFNFGKGQIVFYIQQSFLECLDFLVFNDNFEEILPIEKIYLVAKFLIEATRATQ